MEKLTVFYSEARVCGFAIKERLYGFAYTYGDCAERERYIEPKLAKAIVDIFNNLDFTDSKQTQFKALLELVDTL